MLKIMVYDTGWGGELVANFLEKELNVVEVVRVIDWAHPVACAEDMTVLKQRIADQLQSYIGQVDLIVLGGYVVSMALPFLRQNYPEQKFVGMSIDYRQVLATRMLPEQILTLMNPAFDTEDLRATLQTKFPYSAIIIPDCAGWEELIDRDLMTIEVIRAELAWDFVLCPAARSPRRAVKTELDKTLETLRARILTPQESAGKRAIASAVQNFERAARFATRAEALAVAEASPEIANGELRPDVVLIFDTHFWSLRPILEKLFGWNVRIIDFRQKLLHDVCLALGLRGVDGYRNK